MAGFTELRAHEGTAGGERSRHSGAFVFVFGCLFASSVVLLVTAAARILDPVTAFGAHACSVLVAAALHRSCAGPRRNLYSIGLMMTLIAGPIGSVGTLIALASVSRIPPADLDRWYGRLKRTNSATNSEAIVANLLDGRAFTPQAGLPRDFRDTITNGTLAARQALLGLIGLKYHPEYYDVLKLALSSPEASVRVQAAAVFANLREQYKRRLRVALDAAAQPAVDLRARLDLVHAINEVLASKFIDSPEARRARARARDLCEQILAVDPTHTEAEFALCRSLYDDANYDALVTRRTPLTGGPARTEDERVLELVSSAMLRSGRLRELAALRRGTSSIHTLRTGRRPPSRQVGPETASPLRSVGGPHA